jgi:hypothetical protein
MAKHKTPDGTDVAEAACRTLRMQADVLEMHIEKYRQGGPSNELASAVAEAADDLAAVSRSLAGIVTSTETPE